MRDLLVVAADKSMEQALKGLFERPEALGIRQIEADIYFHPQHDPACALRGVEFMSNFSTQYQYGLLTFDHVGSGKEQTDPQELQEALNEKFARSAWGNRARAIVLSPELEAWVWSDSPHVSRIAGWPGRDRQLRSWLIERQYLQQGQTKPARPKEAFEAALYESRTPRSSSLYLQLARNVSFDRCSDIAFLELKRILQEWFPSH